MNCSCYWWWSLEIFRRSSPSALGMLYGKVIKFSCSHFPKSKEKTTLSVIEQNEYARTNQRQQTERERLISVFVMLT